MDSVAKGGTENRGENVMNPRALRVVLGSSEDEADGLAVVANDFNAVDDIGLFESLAKGVPFDVAPLFGEGILCLTDGIEADGFGPIDLVFGLGEDGAEFGGVHVVRVSVRGAVRTTMHGNTRESRRKKSFFDSLQPSRWQCNNRTSKDRGIVKKKTPEDRGSSFFGLFVSEPTVSDANDLQSVTNG